MCAAAGYLADVAWAVKTLQGQQAELVGRAIGVEASQRSRAESADAAVQDLVGQARGEFPTRAQSVAQLREQAQRDIVALRGQVSETWAALEVAPSSWQAECGELLGAVWAQHSPAAGA
eukprot:9204425-Alexandrium_andersonii.AAC.1